MTIAAHFTDSNCAFVVDLQTPEVNSTRPYCVLPQDVAVADEPLQPLPCATATPPRQIRVFNRARSYWLVTYLRRHRDKDHLFWGYIDWDESPATLRELNTAAAFDAAKFIVGII